MIVSTIGGALYATLLAMDIINNHDVLLDYNSSYLHLGSLVFWKKQNFFSTKMPNNIPIEILKHRFAKGEITQEEYDERRAVLEEVAWNSPLNILQKKFVAEKITAEEYEDRKLTLKWDEIL